MSSSRSDYRTALRGLSEKEFIEHDRLLVNDLPERLAAFAREFSFAVFSGIGIGP